jgi:hypothetical protein
MNNKKVSKRREQSAAKDVDGLPHIGSGNTWFSKADFSDNDDILYEDKFVNDKKYRLSLPILTKIEAQAKKVGKTPVLRFGFMPWNINYAVLRECDCTHVVEKYLTKKTILLKKTNKKSINLELNYLKELYLSSDDNIFLLCVSFGEQGYYILQWETFVEYKKEFCE